ncbi:hypothetical protein [Variovorax boronicumulans]|uniref:hypothetical protein n=1 Tax=Variovorax boronicumulans TaxID=436515 RepID=UPI001C576222
MQNNASQKCKWLAVAWVALALPGCAMTQYGECFSRCGGNMPRSFAAPADPLRGALWGDVVFGKTEKYTIFGFGTLERVGEPLGTGKVDAQAYVPGVTAQQAQGSAWFSAVFGDDYIDPATLMSRKGRIPTNAPLMPPGIYKLTAQASIVEKVSLPSKKYAFLSPPQSTNIVVEAGKWTILWHRVKVDESTEPMTVTVEFGQSGQDALPRLRKSGGSSFSPEFLIADPLPPSASSAPPLQTGAP